jgi:uncharacterized protein YndB with AHSA1/START domain
MAEFAETAESTAERLRVRGILPRATPDEVYGAFTDPELLARWWGEEADVLPVVGGRLVVRWPSMEWTFRGVYNELDPGRTVAFSWAWDHAPDTPTRSVRIALGPTESGTILHLSHGDYGPADAAERRGHLEGWEYFLARLATLFEP